jgi:hypothetical protein
MGIPPALAIHVAKGKAASTAAKPKAASERKMRRLSTSHVLPKLLPGRELLWQLGANRYARARFARLDLTATTPRARSIVANSLLGPSGGGHARYAHQQQAW